MRISLSFVFFSSYQIALLQCKMENWEGGWKVRMDQVCGKICYSKGTATVQQYEAVFIAIFQIGNNINIARTFKRNNVGIQNSKSSFTYVPSFQVLS